MTVGDCANNPPTNTWNDHTDSMSMRDAGWIQLYAETDQEALDLHIQAFRLAEAIACPVMVCIDGYRLAHGCDRLDVPAQRQVDDYLPRYGYRSVAKVGVRSTRVMAGAETFMERCYLAHHKQLRALAVIPKLADDFRAQFGRPSGGLLRTYRLDDAETVVVGLGSVCGAIRNAVDDLRARGASIGCVSIGSFRPFPSCALRDVLQHARRVVVIERSLAVGLSGIISDGVREALSGQAVNTHTVIAGLGGRAIPATSLRQLFEDAAADGLGQTTFLDLNADVVARHLECEAQSRSSESATL
jgi:pyruvate ferredoxin oxidoreductase alpha subunit